MSEFATGRAHEARLAEDAQVVGEQVAGDRHLLVDVAHAALALGENPHDRQPGRIGEGSEPIGRLNAG